jgi:hypothetical protein
MSSSWQWDLVIALSSGVVLLTAGYVYEKAAEWKDKKVHPAPGRIVAVGDHKLHLLYKASVGPTIVIEQGAGSHRGFGGASKIKSPSSPAFVPMIEPVTAGASRLHRDAQLQNAPKNSTLCSPTRVSQDLTFW